jgi:solute carrier family 15 oligopeptide transporter 1
VRVIFCDCFSEFLLLLFHPAILAIFLSDKVGLNEDTATAIVHFYYFAAYVFGIPGAIIADNWLGRYKTLLFGMSFLGGVGNVLMVIGTIEYLNYLLR